MGLTDEDESHIEDLILQRQQSQEDKIKDMQRSYDQLSSENVDFKYKIRKLKTALRESLKHKLSKTNGISSDGEHIEELSHRSESKKDQVELRRIKENVKWIIDENEALRQGMHEILDSIHNHDGNGFVFTIKYLGFSMFIGNYHIFRKEYNQHTINDVRKFTRSFGRKTRSWLVSSGYEIARSSQLSARK